ncbi:MAG: hypothetical protein EXS50_02370 [Candidatus Taylorbacteria bacterium]|nr:hypothetical protein [Candidatus Taylorbacteria bacterium]
MIIASIVALLVGLGAGWFIRGLRIPQQIVNTELEDNFKLQLKQLEEKLTEKQEVINELKSTQASNKATIDGLSARKNELDIEIALVKEQLRGAQEELKNVKQQNAQLVAEEKNRIDKYQNDVATLATIKKGIEEDRNKEVEKENNEQIEYIKNQKDTWAKHQANVKNTIKNIASKLTIEYVAEVPFRGEPDNTLKICDEFVIFDAKSPGTDDVTNFPDYLKAQAESAKKYAKKDNVKPDIFFVIPTNTLGGLEKFVFNLGDYNVFIIAVDSLEQIILSLKKIEEYEFAEQLSPEDRDSICRILGQFAHMTKRRVQIDSYFMKESIELMYKADNKLPKEILDKAIEYERSEKLNPPSDKRAKVLSIKDLEKDSIKLKKETSSRGIAVNEDNISSGIENINLYQSDVAQEKPKIEK